MKKFIDFQKFPDTESAIDLMSLLDKNSVPFEINDRGQRFSLVSNPDNHFIIIRIAEEDIDRVNQLCDENENKDFENVTNDHYLYTFSDDDIIDIIANPSEWTRLEIRLANELAAQRKLTLSAEILSKAKKRKMEDVVREDEKVKNKVKYTANWFAFIAVLSVLNSLALTMKIKIRMMYGLGITQISDAVIYKITGQFNYYNVIVTAGLSSILLIFWHFGRKEKKWAFVVGSMFYGLDSLVFLSTKDWWSLGFHIFGVIGIVSGYMTLLENKSVAGVEANRDKA